MGGAALVFVPKNIEAGQMSSHLNPNPENPKTKATTLLDRTFRDREGRIVIAQMPNLPLLGVGSDLTSTHTPQR